MVHEQLRSRDITDQLVLEAMGTVPRERFVPAKLGDSAYKDGALSIGHGQTISQPYVVALMAQALHVTPSSRVLEVGTGSGYGAAVLSRIAGQVITIERVEQLAGSAREVLGEIGYNNVTVICGDGTLGWPARAPYDGIVVTAGGPEVPAALMDQLGEGGSLVIPVGTTPNTQQLVQVTRRGASLTRRSHGGVRFVPLIGEQGW